MHPISSDGGPGERERPLWQWAFLWIGEMGNLTVFHPLDEERAKVVMADLSVVGERPTYEEVKQFLAEAWPAFPGSQRDIRSLWRRIERNPGHRFRHKRPLPRLYTLDRLVAEHGLRPLEERIHESAARALSSLSAMASGGGRDEFTEAKAELERASMALEDLRALRFGPASVGRWWDDFENPEPPAGTRGALT
jgi:hypothetical protein